MPLQPRLGYPCIRKYEMKKQDALSAIKEALRQSWKDKDDFLRLALIPAIFLLLISIPLSDAVTNILKDSAPPTEEAMLEKGPILAILSLGYLLVVGLFSTNWLRFLAFGRIPMGFLGLRIGLAHLRFSLSLLAGIIFLSTLLNLLFLLLGGFISLYMIAALGMVIGTWLLLRLMPYFVGLALDRPMRIAQAWRMTKSLMLPMFGAFFMLQILLFLAEQGIALLLSALGLLIIAPHASYFILSFAELARVAIIFTLIFYFYRRMTELELVV